MATQTTYYDLIKVEGTDLVNPLTQLNPNMDAIDAAMHGLSVNAIGTAVEVITGTVHALTRVNQTDAKFIQFIASGDYDSGDTFTLDGVAINATYPDGTSLETDAYATGATVLIGLNADDSTATFYLSKAGSGIATDSERLGGELPTFYSSKSYADGIKTTADAAADAVAKKALVNVYYDTSTQKLYRVLADGSQGAEIPINIPAMTSKWTNNSPAASFAGQTITVSGLSSAKEICIKIRSSNTASEENQLILELNNSTTEGQAIICASGTLRYRKITVNKSTNEVVFGGGYSGSTASNTSAIPTEILIR